MKQMRFALLLGLFIMMVGIMPAGAATPKDTFVWASIGAAGTLDPARAYDTGSQEPLFNVYEPLIFYDGGSTERFVPVLATKVPTIENGGIKDGGKTIIFNIRKGVKFHNGAIMTPKDVEYSFERVMLCDPDGGPLWMLFEALIGNEGTRDDNGKFMPDIVDKVAKAIEVKGDDVILHLPAPYPPIMGILTTPMCSVTNKEWAIAHGCWDGKYENAQKFNNPKGGEEPLAKITMGTGPYMIKEYDPATQVIYERFEGYWGKKPAFKNGICKLITEWSTRKTMMQNNDLTVMPVQSVNYPETKEMKNISVVQVPSLSVTTAFFCQKIEAAGNSFIGSGKLDGQGIPPDFFSDINVRKAFQHCFNAKMYKQEVANNLGEILNAPLPKGLPYQKDVQGYDFDLEKAANYMKKAWNGQVWEKGFKMTLLYNTGNNNRQMAAQMLAENIQKLNPKFKVETANVEWKEYWVKYRQHVYPMFIIGWVADFADPHNFLYTFMNSKGDYGKHIMFKNDEIDKLTDMGIKEARPAERKKIYEKLQDLWVEYALGINVIQPVTLEGVRNDIKAQPFNPVMADMLMIKNFEPK